MPAVRCLWRIRYVEEEIWKEAGIPLRNPRSVCQAQRLWWIRPGNTALRHREAHLCITCILPSKCSHTTSESEIERKCDLLTSKQMTEDLHFFISLLFFSIDFLASKSILIRFHFTVTWKCDVMWCNFPVNEVYEKCMSLFKSCNTAVRLLKEFRNKSVFRTVFLSSPFFFFLQFDFCNLFSFYFFLQPSYGPQFLMHLVARMDCSREHCSELVESKKKKNAPFNGSTKHQFEGLCYCVKQIGQL